MFLRRGSRALGQLNAAGSISLVFTGAPPTPTRRRGRDEGQPRQYHAFHPTRNFHATRDLRVVKPVLLADIGEGIVECEIIQWFVEPGARVEEFSPLCEVQSDKASVEITSRFTGVVKKLHYDAGEMAKVGKPFVDIDIQGEVKTEDLEALTPAEPEPPASPSASASASASSTPDSPSPTIQQAEAAAESGLNKEGRDAFTRQDVVAGGNGGGFTAEGKKKGKMAALATPAVRHLSKELKVDISDIDGTGRDGRVLKEDIYKFVQARDSHTAPIQAQSPAASQPSTTAGGASSQQTETRVQLSHTQQMMFKTMTRSLSIPHFLYADEVDVTNLVDIRARLNKVLADPDHRSIDKTVASVPKLSYLPFIIKAVSLALYSHPILNARVDVDQATGKASLAMRSQHNIGVAMDTPSGLLVPVIRGVEERNILSIAAELSRLQASATAGKLSPQDFSGGTISVSNIGSIGGTYVSPVIVERELAILGVGRMRTVPAFDEEDRVVKRHVCNFSWCADHRVVDGATLARAAAIIKKVIEEPNVMLMHFR